MSQRITIQITDKIATCLTETPVVCGNCDYVIDFKFDKEWDNHDVKTATFVVNGKRTEKVFTGTVCEMPMFQNTLVAWVGVFAGTVDDGTLATSTPALVHCRPCATDGDNLPAPPADDVYNQIVGLCENAVDTAKEVERRANEGEFDGEKGEDGYTPQKGIDYFTEGDKAEIVEDVLAVLPNDAEKIAYYGDANIETSKESLFTFTELGDGTYSIAAKNVWNLNGHIVLPYKHNGKLVTEITSGGFASHDDNNHITSITGLTIPRTIRAINNTAFARNDIPEIIIPGSCKTIGKTAFYQSKMKKLVLEEGVESIGQNAFTGCSNVTYCVIPSTINSIYTNSFAGAGQVKDVYYGGSQKQFEWKNIAVDAVINGNIAIVGMSLKEILTDWIWQANVYYNYGNDAEVSKVSKAVAANTVAIEAIKTAVSKGMTIKETILYSGQKFYIHPNSFYIAMPPSKKLAIYYGDGRTNDPYEDEAGIVVGVNSAVNSNDGKFRSATIIQTAGSILSSGGTAIYAYFLDNADEINGGTGAYLQWNGASDTYCPVLHSVPVEIEEYQKNA